MLNYMWAFMILVGILWGAFHGTMSQVTQGASSTMELCRNRMTITGQKMWKK